MVHPDTAVNFLTLQEAASMLQVSKRTLHRLLQRQKMPGLKIASQRQIRESEFKEWVQ
jgi:excisionase family DNA binding protein